MATQPLTSMSSATATGKNLPTDHLDAAHSLLNNLTSHSTMPGAFPSDSPPAEAPTLAVDPKDTLHTPSTTEKAHSWFRAVFPYDSLADLESQWHLGNYVIDRKTGEKHFEEMSVYVRVGMHLLYYGSEQSKALHWKRTIELLREQSVKMGKQYDAPESKDHIQPFIDSFHLRSTLPDLAQPDPTKYPNFNSFFARSLRKNARPIDEPTNNKVISSPADCRLTAYPTVDLATKYWIKGFGFTIPRLLGSDELAKRFEGGSIVIARLAPQDYHRWHSPVDGTVQSITEIPGTYYTVNPQAINESGTLDVFCENRRSVMLLQRTTTQKPVAVIAVGAMLVGSIKYDPSVTGQSTDAPATTPTSGPTSSAVVKSGTEVKRGQCLGAFYYGGSTVIVLFPKDEVRLDEDLVKNSCEKQCETLVRVGWRVAAGP